MKINLDFEKDPASASVDFDVTTVPSTPFGGRDYISWGLPLYLTGLKARAIG